MMKTRNRKTGTPAYAGVVKLRERPTLEQLESRNLLSVCYNLTDLGTLASPFNDGSGARGGLNDAAQIAGQSNDLNLLSGELSHAFQWQNETMTDLHDSNLGYTSSNSWAISSSGHVAGNLTIPNSGGPATQAFVWDSTDGMINLGSFDQNGLSTAGTGVNSSKTVTGHAEVYVDDDENPTRQHVFKWRNGTWTDLLTLEGVYGHAEARGINNDGFIIGGSTAGLMPEERHAFLWHQSTGMVDVHPDTQYTGSTAYAINNDEDVGGWVELNSIRTGYTVDNDTVDIFQLRSPLTITGHTASDVAGINDDLQVVGNSSHDNVSDFLAVRWDPTDSAAINLNTELCNGLVNFTLRYAFDINNNGQIVGSMQYNSVLNPYWRGFLLTPSASPIGGAGDVNPALVTAVIETTQGDPNGNPARSWLQSATTPEEAKANAAGISTEALSHANEENRMLSPASGSVYRLSAAPINVPFGSDPLHTVESALVPLA